MRNQEKLKGLLMVIVMLFITVACVDTKPKSTEAKESEAFKLIKLRCYACHNPESPSHDEILAPPFAAVKMRYQMQYKSEEEFVEAVVNWTMDPLESNALMRGAVQRFKTMPKQPFNEVEIKKIATYIFKNQLEEPDWFAAHQKEMRTNGQMEGMGRKNVETKTRVESQ